MKYLAMIQNTDQEYSITYEASDFKNAERSLKERVKKGSMFSTIKLIELDSLISKKFYIEK